MDKIESVVPRLDVHFSSGHEDGFEPGALCSNTAVGTRLGAFPDITNSDKVHRVKTVFISLDNNLI